MKKLAIALMCMFSLSAMAEGKNYWGVQYGMATYSESGFPDYDLGALIFRVGQKVNKNFAFEGRIGIGIADETQTILGTPITVELDNMFGIYAIGIAPVSKDVDIYGLIGFTDGELTVSGPGGSLSGSDSGVSFGFGVDFAASGKVSWNVEYVSYIDEDFIDDISSISIGAKFAF